MKKVIKSLLDNHFQKAIVVRGHQYFKAKRIQIIDQEPGIIHFVSENSSGAEYSGFIEIDFKESEILDASCSCPYKFYCKHMAGALYELDNGDFIFNQINRENNLTIMDHPHQGKPSKYLKAYLDKLKIAKKKELSKIEKKTITDIDLNLNKLYACMGKTESYAGRYFFTDESGIFFDKLSSQLRRLFFDTNDLFRKYVYEYKPDVEELFSLFFVMKQAGNLKQYFWDCLDHGLIAKTEERVYRLEEEVKLIYWQKEIRHAEYLDRLFTFNHNKDNNRTIETHALDAPHYFRVSLDHKKLSLEHSYVEEGPFFATKKNLLSAILDEIVDIPNAIDRSILQYFEEVFKASKRSIIDFSYDALAAYSLLNKVWGKSKVVHKGELLKTEATRLYYRVKKIKSENTSLSRESTTSVSICLGEQEIDFSPTQLFRYEKMGVFMHGQTLYLGPFHPVPLNVPAKILNEKKSLATLKILGYYTGTAMPEEIQQKSMERRVDDIYFYLDDLKSLDDALIVELRIKTKDEKYIYTLDHETMNYVWKDMETKKDAGFKVDGDAILPLLLSDIGFETYVSMGGESHQKTIYFKYLNKFYAWLQSIPDRYSLRARGEIASLLKKPVRAKSSVSVEPSGIDWFTYKVSLESNAPELTDKELKTVLKSNGKFVHIPKKGWYQTEENSEMSLSMDQLGLMGDSGKIHALQLASFNPKKNQEENSPWDEIDSKYLEQAKKRKAEIEKKPLYVSPNITGELRSYQREGLKFLQFLSDNELGGILADDMGLGKTFQCLAWIQGIKDGWNQPKKVKGKQHLKEQGSNDFKVLIVAPKSVMDNWVLECQKFTPNLKAKVITGKDLIEGKDPFAVGDIFISNYALLRSKKEFFLSQAWTIAILDEAQNIKTPSAKATKVSLELSARHRLAVTGTPIENRLLDLFSITSFAMPGYLGSMKYFEDHYGRTGNVTGVRNRMRPIMLRRTKNMVAKDLPERIEEDIYVRMEGKQLSYYMARLKQAQAELNEITSSAEFDKARFGVLTHLLRLRQLCCSPQLVDPSFSKIDSPKVDVLMEKVRELIDEGNKVLVFSQFVDLLNILKRRMEESKIKHYMITGKTSKRQGMVDAFQKDSDPAAFLLSIKAAGSGLNLTSASYVFIFDPWWNPAVENQAIDRTHRIGQESTVFAYRLIIKDSIEEKVREMQLGKQSLSDDLFSEDSFSKSLSLGQIKELLN